MTETLADVLGTTYPWRELSIYTAMLAGALVAYRLVVAWGRMLAPTLPYLDVDPLAPAWWARLTHGHVFGTFLLVWLWLSVVAQTRALALGAPANEASVAMVAVNLCIIGAMLFLPVMHPPKEEDHDARPTASRSRR